jgi:hypothetical protein
MLKGCCNECDYTFDATNSNVHIGTKFLLFDYAYIICPNCKHKMIIPESLYKHFGIVKE